MNRMNMPRYTAEASLYSSGQCYQSTGAWGALPGRRFVLPQMSRDEFICHMNCEADDTFCHARCDLDYGGGGDGGGGGGGEHCTPACGPCYPDPGSPMGGFRTCVDYNCNTYDRQCRARRFPRNMESSLASLR
jgi:hypothetical protein